jgi:RHS repeat-associated protein
MFGSAVYSSSSYRYGFQGQEKDDEVSGEGNSINFEFRMYNSRLGRFMAIDPLSAKYPSNTPYAFSQNRVIDGVELEGLEYVNVTAIANPSTGETFIDLFGDIIDNNPQNVVTYAGEIYYKTSHHLYTTTNPNAPISFMDTPGSTRITEWLYTDIQNVDINTEHIYGWNDATVTGSKTFDGKVVQNNQNCAVLADKQNKELGSTSSSVNIPLLNSSDNQKTYYDKNVNQAVDYINRELEEGRTVKIGVEYEPGVDHNSDGTDHFVVLTGRGVDLNGMEYFTFVDNRYNTKDVNKNLGVRKKEDPMTSTQNRLYITKGEIKGNPAYSPSLDYIITKVIKNVITANKRPLDAKD